MAADDIMAFMTRVKRKLVDDDAQYATFVRALHRWEQQAIGTDELEASVTDADAAVAYLRGAEASVGDEARYGEFLALLRLWEAGRVEIDALVRDVPLAAALENSPFAEYQVSAEAFRALHAQLARPAGGADERLRLERDAAGAGAGHE
ncbi:hypothetical protein SO694_00077185 [Aureococcus anophagefferens]|uniref:Uncharacterized protein n=1 Tax=Aureococcus anophagefferens TaxID=44056 RepID=A0ABR1FHP0_AURAN